MADEPDDLDSAAVFSLLGDETRLAIVSALHDGSVAPPASFSTLYEQVDVRDSAKFNYHLGELRPHFVRKSEDGYALTSAGRRLARAVTAGTYTDRPTIEPFDIDGRCYACDAAALRAAYEDETLTVACGDCGETVLAVRVPPTVVRGREPAAVVDAFETWSMEQVRQARRGICPDCGGPVEGSIDDDLAETIAFEAAVAYECTVCGRRATTSFGTVAYHHPAVRTFHRQRGDPLGERRLWEVDQFVCGEHVEIESRDPWLVTVSFFADGDACRVEIDETLAVSRVEIVPDAGGA